MFHGSDGTLRRIEDEPFAVPDSTFEHVARCPRCQARRPRIAADAARAAQLLSGPQLVADVDRGWDDLAEQLGQTGQMGPLGPLGQAQSGFPSLPNPRPRRAGVAKLSARATVAAGVAAAALVGTAAAATLTNVFAPTHVAPLKVTAQDLKGAAQLMSLVSEGNLAGFPTPNGTGTLPFGTLRWRSAGAADQVRSLTAANALTGLSVSLPRHLPSGIGSPTTYSVQPKVTATVSFDAAAGTLAGSTLTLDAGPGEVVGYGSGASGIPTLAILAMQRPTASSSGASLTQIESFLLSRPGITSGLAEEVRLLGNLSTVLPVPTPAGLASQTVQVGGHPGVVIADPSGVASAVVWEDGAGIVHVVAGLVNQEGAVGVADQIG